MSEDMTCNGYKKPGHPAPYVYHDGLCQSCRYLRDTDHEPVEPPEPETRDDDHAADIWERTNWRDW